MGLYENTYNTTSFPDFMDATRSESPGPGMGEVFGGNFLQSLTQESPTTSLLYNKTMAPPLAYEPAPVTQYNPRMPQQQKLMIPDEVANKGDYLYKDGNELRKDYPAVPFEQGMTKSRAKYIDDNISLRDYRAELSKSRPYSAMLGSFLGGVPDVTNFIPVGGELGLASETTNAAAKFLMPYAKTAADNVVNVGIADTIVQGQREKYGANVNVFDDMTSAALAGVVIHGGTSVLKKAFGSKDLKLDPPTDKTLPKAPVPDSITAAEVVAPVSEAPMDFGNGITGSYRADNSNIVINGEKQVRASRMVINDGIYNVAQGLEPVASDATKALVNELGPQMIYHAEARRYDLAMTPEDRMRETELRSTIDKLKAEDKPLDSAYYQTVHSEEILKHTNELVALQSKYAGYKPEVNKLISDLDYRNIPTHQELPKAISDLMSAEQKKRFDELVSHVEGAGVDKTYNSIAERDKLIGSVVSPLYAGTYGRVYHGTSKLFNKFDDKKLGTTTGAKDTIGHYFAANPEMASEFSSMSAEEFYDGNDRFTTKDANVRMHNLEFKKPFVVDADKATYPRRWDLHQYAKDNGHDGVIILNETDEGHKGTVYVAFNKDQIHDALKQREISWAEPRVEYGQATIKEDMPIVNKLIASVDEKTKMVDEAKHQGYDLNSDNALALSPEDQISLDVLESQLPPEEFISLTNELAKIDEEFKKSLVEESAENNYINCRGLK